MKKYGIRFNGRENRAIGEFYTIEETVSANTREEAINKLYDKYEHITQIKFFVDPDFDGENEYKR